jgi:hypothetical protein
MIRNIQKNISALKQAIKLNKYNEQLLINQGYLLSIEFSKANKISCLSTVEWKIFSQWGDDGILDWLIHNLPGISQKFIEFGVEDYRESNTRFLLQKRNWSGLVIDGSLKHISNIKKQEICWKYSLKPVHAFISSENINELISLADFDGEIGILSIDIDGNDYWVWEAITTVNPIITVVEFNATFGNIHAISIPYNPSFIRQKAHFSNQYYGASLPAFNFLAEKKGYTFIGTNSSGVNAYYIRNDWAINIVPKIDLIRSFPSAFSDHRLKDGKLTFERGSDRLNLIKHLPVVDVKNLETLCLSDYSNFYENDWLDKS